MQVDMVIRETPRGYVVSMESLAGPIGKKFVVEQDVWGPCERKPPPDVLNAIVNTWGVVSRLFTYADKNDSPFLDPRPANDYIRGEETPIEETVRGMAQHEFVASIPKL